VPGSVGVTTRLAGRRFFAPTKHSLGSAPRAANELLDQVATEFRVHANSAPSATTSLHVIAHVEDSAPAPKVFPSSAPARLKQAHHTRDRWSRRLRQAPVSARHRRPIGGSASPASRESARLRAGRWSPDPAATSDRRSAGQPVTQQLGHGDGTGRPRARRRGWETRVERYSTSHPPTKEFALDAPDSVLVVPFKPITEIEKTVARCLASIDFEAITRKAVQEPLEGLAGRV
jgi:hypothetical protein